MGLWTDPDARAGSSYEWLHQPARPVGTPPPPPPKPPQRRTGRLIAALCGRILLVALVTAASIALIGGGSNEPTQAIAPLPVSKGATGKTRINQIYQRVQSAV